MIEVREKFTIRLGTRLQEIRLRLSWRLSAFQTTKQTFFILFWFHAIIIDADNSSAKMFK